MADPPSPRFTDEADQQRALVEMHGLYCLSRPSAFLVENILIYFSDNSLQCGYPPLLPSTGLRSRTFH